MSFQSLCSSQADVYQPTNYLIERREVSASIPIEFQPPLPCQLSCEIEGSDCTGEVIFEGLDGECQPITETLTYISPFIKQTEKIFASLDAVLTSGLVEEVPKPTIAVRAVQTSGAPLEMLRKLYTIPIRTWQEKGVLSLDEPGMIPQVILRFASSCLDLESGYILKIDEKDYRTTEVIKVRAYSKDHHVEGNLEIS
ncbi:TPA: hypothetical protein DCX15_06575 [bacterium]|nr:hypothetical protein [bacterium]